MYFIIKLFSEREGIADDVVLKGSADPGNHHWPIQELGDTQET